MILKYWNSRTFKDLLHQIPKLSRPYSIFKDFPGPGKMGKNFKDFQELSRPCGHPERKSNKFRYCWHAVSGQCVYAASMLSSHHFLQHTDSFKFAWTQPCCVCLDKKKPHSPALVRILPNPFPSCECPLRMVPHIVTFFYILVEALKLHHSSFFLTLSPL